VGDASELHTRDVPGGAQRPPPETVLKERLRREKPHFRAGEYDGIEYSGLPIKPTHVRYHQTHQGISDTPELPTIHQVPGAPMML
jgi:hypothetical protein